MKFKVISESLYNQLLEDTNSPEVIKAINTLAKNIDTNTNTSQFQNNMMRGIAASIRAARRGENIAVVKGDHWIQPQNTNNSNQNNSAPNDIKDSPQLADGTLDIIEYSSNIWTFDDFSKIQKTTNAENTKKVYIDGLSYLVREIDNILQGNDDYSGDIGKNHYAWIDGNIYPKSQYQATSDNDGKVDNTNSNQINIKKMAETIQSNANKLKDDSIIFIALTDEYIFYRLIENQKGTDKYGTVKVKNKVYYIGDKNSAVSRLNSDKNLLPIISSTETKIISKEDLRKEIGEAININKRLERERQKFFLWKRQVDPKNKLWNKDYNGKKEEQEAEIPFSIRKDKKGNWVDNGENQITYQQYKKDNNLDGKNQMKRAVKGFANDVKTAAQNIAHGDFDAKKIFDK